jgi:hypothetical protein
MKILERVEGNRTLVISLEGRCSTIELHPRAKLTPYERYDLIIITEKLLSIKF